MHLKDYYRILELPPSASPDEVKKAYRRLALQFHPDRNGNDPYAAARFTEVKEAYETMTNPVKKDQYLQQRWYAQSIGRPMAAGMVSPVTILQKMLELDKYTSTLDIHRMDREGLHQYINHVLSDENISKLNSFNDPVINTEIILSSLKSGRLLSLPFLKDLADRLRKIESFDLSAGKQIDNTVRNATQTEYWEKKRVWVVILIVVIISISIFLTSR